MDVQEEGQEQEENTMNQLSSQESRNKEYLESKTRGDSQEDVEEFECPTEGELEEEERRESEAESEGSSDHSSQTTILLQGESRKRRRFDIAVLVDEEEKEEIAKRPRMGDIREWKDNDADEEDVINLISKSKKDEASG